MSEQVSMAVAPVSGLWGGGLLDEIQDGRPLMPDGVWVPVSLWQELLWRVSVEGS